MRFSFEDTITTVSSKLSTGYIRLSLAIVWNLLSLAPFASFSPPRYLSLDVLKICQLLNKRKGCEIEECLHPEVWTNPYNLSVGLVLAEVIKAVRESYFLFWLISNPAKTVFIKST